eukprot:gene4836-6778_t
MSSISTISLFTEYNGVYDRICDWCTHFRADEEIRIVLQELGVETVEDLQLLFPDLILTEMRLKLSNVNFDNFLSFCKQTANLTDIDFDGFNARNLMEENMVAVHELENEIKQLKLYNNSSSTQVKLDEIIKKRNDMLHDEKIKCRTINALNEKSNTLIKNQKIKKRYDLIQELDQQLIISSTLDVAFVMDCTGSMTPYIENVKAQIQQFVEKVTGIYPNVLIRLAFVGYRDHENGFNRSIKLNFTTSMIEFINLLKSVQPISNTDEPEDVLGGLQNAVVLSWQSATRILYHIGDSPCHGREFHSLQRENYPHGDPLGLKPDVILKSLQAMNIIYYFGKITKDTDIMIEKFNKLLNFEYIITTPLNAANMMDITIRTVSIHFSSKLSGSSKTIGDNDMIKSIPLDKSTPNWCMIPYENARKFYMHDLKSFDELLNPINDFNVVNKVTRVTDIRIKCAKKPFAKGDMRIASWAKENEFLTVLKESITNDQKKRDISICESFLTSHQAATFLSTKFNKIKPMNCPNVTFCEVQLLQMLDRPSQPYLYMEVALPGEFEKFNNNSGMCSPNPTKHGVQHDAVHAFSHWTHHITNGQLIVVDCQGVYEGGTETFILTDPAVHCHEVLRFDQTNLGSKGIDRFFNTHKCNAFCLALKLSK